MNTLDKGHKLIKILGKYQDDLLNHRYNQLTDERIYIMIRKAVIVARERFNHAKWFGMGGIVYDEAEEEFKRMTNE